MRVLVFLLTFLLSTSLFAGEKVEAGNIRGIGRMKTAMPEKWHRLNDLIEGEIKTIKSIKSNMGPSLEYRLLELYSEKLALIKEYENKIYLDESTKGVKKKKSAWFTASLSEYKRVKSFGLGIIKRFPRFLNNADIYYTMALNSRDYGNDNKIESYLKLSLKLAPKGAPIIHSSKVSLAEYYYNQKKYSGAVKLYNDILANKQDPWLPKHYYNAGWCRLKTKNFDKAISYLHSSYKLGKKEEYTSVEEQVLDALYIFHVHANRIEEAVDFYKKELEDPSKYLIKMAKSTADKGLFKQTRMVLKEALERVIRQKAYGPETNIRLAELEIYRNFKKNELFYKTAQRICKLHGLGPLTIEQKEEAVHKISGFVGYLQVRLSKNARKNIKKYDKQTLVHIIDYFDILAVIDPAQTDKYRYYQGETLFAVNKYASAAEKYRDSLEHSKKKDTPNEEETKLRKKVMTALLGTLSEDSGWKKNQKKEYTIYTYENHIRLYPKDEVSREIYTRLFNLYLSMPETAKAVATVDLYEKSFPQDMKKQRDLITRVIDHHIKRKEALAISGWIERLKKGYLNFDKDYVEKATIILGKILFEGFQKMEDGGNTADAVEGYMSLYENDKYPAPVRAQAAFTIALLKLKLSKTEDSAQWYSKADQHLAKDKHFAVRKQILAMSEKMGMLQNFKAGEQMAEKFMDKFCLEKYKEEKDFFRLVFNYKLLEEKGKEAMEFLNKAPRCGFDEEIIRSLKKEMLTHLVRFNKYEQVLAHYEQTKDDPFLILDHAGHHVDLYWRLEEEGKQDLAARFWKNLPEIEGRLRKIHKAHEKMREKIVAAQNYMKFKSEVEAYLSRKISAQDESFDDKKYNTELGGMMNDLKALTDKLPGHLKTGQAQVTLGSYHILMKAYKHLAGEIRNFKLNGVDKDFKEGFGKQMAMIVRQLEKQSFGMQRGGRVVIENNNILQNLNEHFLTSNQEGGVFRFPASAYFVPVDHKGVRR